MNSIERINYIISYCVVINKYTKYKLNIMFLGVVCFMT